MYRTQPKVYVRSGSKGTRPSQNETLPATATTANLWHTTEIWEKIDYCHHYPVRRGLCTKPEVWFWSSADYFLDQRTGPLKINLESRPERIEFVRRRGLLKFES